MPEISKNLTLSRSAHIYNILISLGLRDTPPKFLFYPYSYYCLKRKTKQVTFYLFI